MSQQSEQQQRTQPHVTSAVREDRMRKEMMERVLSIIGNMCQSPFLPGKPYLQTSFYQSKQTEAEREKKKVEVM